MHEPHLNQSITNASKTQEKREPRPERDDPRYLPRCARQERGVCPNSAPTKQKAQITCIMHHACNPSIRHSSRGSREPNASRTKHNAKIPCIIHAWPSIRHSSRGAAAATRAPNRRTVDRGPDSPNKSWGSATARLFKLEACVPRAVNAISCLPHHNRHCLQGF